MIEYKTTTNRYVYNRLRKEYIGVCTYCGYHKGDNSRNKWYGCYSYRINPKGEIHYPSWKLVSKSKKQWMEKGLKKKLLYSSPWRAENSFEFIF